MRIGQAQYLSVIAVSQRNSGPIRKVHGRKANLLVYHESPIIMWFNTTFINTCTVFIQIEATPSIVDTLK